MATSTPDRSSAITPLDPPPAPKGRARKPSAKVLETHQALRKRNSTLRSAQNEDHITVAVHRTAPQATQNALPPSPAAQESAFPEWRGRAGSFGEFGRLIESLKETIGQQSSIIESIRDDLISINAEQQYLKSQNAELQETIASLREQLDGISVTPPTTQTWASVAASGGVAGSGTTLSRTTSTGNQNKEDNRQLVIDVSRVGEGMAEKVANTEAARQAIQQGMCSVERLTGATVKDFRVWRANNSTSVIKFSVDKDKEAAFRQTTTEWLEPHIPGARLVGPKWHAVKVDWIEVPLAMDAESGKVGRSAMERFGTENGVEVCTMRWLGRPRPSGQHASVVIKVAMNMKEEAEKLLRSDGVMFGGGGIIVSPFEERRTPVACFKCTRLAVT
jgi:hypothetical protein